jgi:hypothetical protein
LRDLHTLDLQTGFIKQAHFSFRRFRRNDLRKKALHFVHAGHVGFAEAEKLSISAADDREGFLFLSVARLTQWHHHLAPVKRFRRRLSHVQLLAGCGGFPSLPADR